MEWWEMQDEIEAQGGAIVYREDGGVLLRLPDGHCLPLCASYSTEGVVIQAHQVFKRFVKTPALLVTPRESRAEQCGSQVRLDGSAGDVSGSWFPPDGGTAGCTGQFAVPRGGTVAGSK